MACLSERELAERCDRQYGRPRTASCPAQTESVCNRRFEPLVHPPSKKKILARETKQGQTSLIRSPRPLFLQQTNSKDIRLVGLAEEEQLKKLTAEPNFKGLGPVFKGDANKVAEALRSADGRQLFEALQGDKSYRLKIDNRDYRITSQMVSFKEEMPENFAMGSFDDGRVYIDLTIPKELVREGFVREIVRRLQEMRKRLDLPVD